MCPRSIAGVPSSQALASYIILLHTTCVRSCCTWRASGVAAKHQKTKKGRKRNFFLVLPSSQSTQSLRVGPAPTVEWALRSVNPQPWRFTYISFDLPRAHSVIFFLCLPVIMSLCRVCLFSSLPVCLFMFCALRV